jgi:hypothetical protein
MQLEEIVVGKDTECLIDLLDAVVHLAPEGFVPCGGLFGCRRTHA